MVTLMYSYLFLNDQFTEILGWVLTSLEIIIVLIKFLQYLVNPDSKFGKFLIKLLPGLNFLKDQVNHLKDHDPDDEDDNGNDS